MYSLIAYPIGIIVTALAVLFGYRVLLHPLRSYPGSLWDKLTNAHGGYLAIRRCQHLAIREYHLKYGPVIRAGPNKLVFNTVQAVRDIYDNDEKIAKSHVYETYVQTPGVRGMFDIIDNETHSQRRRIVGQIINDRSMRIFEPAMTEKIDTFIELLRESSSAPVNMTPGINSLACDIIGLLAFGYQLNLQTEKTNFFLIEGMRAAGFIANVLMQFYFLRQIGVTSFLNALSKATLDRYFALLEKIIAARTAKDVDAHHDLYSIVTKANANVSNPGESIRMSELWSEAMSFFPAGAFSTSGAISAATFYLSRNPECYKRLSEEIRTAFASADDIHSGPVLSNCLYLRAVIDETLRIAPPVPGVLWREARADGPVIIDGHVVPPGTQVGVNTYAIHHNEEYFPDPFAFKPERWLDSGMPDEQKKLMHGAFVPFSLGARGCAGKAMAYLESSLVLAKLLWHFDFRPAQGELGELGGGIPGKTDGRGRKDEYQLYDQISGAHDGPCLILEPRK
ncbi:cytochrome P450 [Xylaria arbuscula]|nr:cytochrome P450 [Xylaria arbuscula]